LCLTQPGIIAEIHRGYFEAGADIVTTNTFNATSVVQIEYGLEDLVYEIARAAASIARAKRMRWRSATARGFALSPVRWHPRAVRHRSRPT
jgi:methionine synthase I (cobalamin-dependent)